MPRTSACSVVRIWSSWTEFEVCWIGIASAALELRGARAAGADVDEQVALEEQARAQLHPGVLCGSAGPCSEIVIVTSAAFDSGIGSTLVTSPTLMPAIRTGLFSAQVLGVRGTPPSPRSRGSVNGIRFVKAR